MKRGSSSDEARPLIAKTELPLSHGEATGEVIAPSNFNHAYVNMVKSLLGIGLFTMPYLTAKAGLLLAVTLLIMFAYLSYECTRMLAVCAAHESRHAGTITVANWRHLAKRSFGPMGASLAVAAIIGSQLGVCTSYVDEMARTFESSGHVRKRVILPILWISLSTVAMSIKPGLRAFAYVSAAAMVALLYDVLLLCVYSWTSPIWRSPLHQDLKLWDFSGLPAFVGPAVFAFECAPTALNIYASMGQVEPTAFLRVSRYVYLTGLVVITLVAFLGYTGFGNDVRRVVLFSFPPNAVGLSAQWVINAVLFLSFNLQLLPAFTLVEAWVLPKLRDRVRNDQSFWAEAAARWSVRSTIVGVVVLLGAAVPDVETVVGLTGSICMTTAIAILPPAFYLKIRPDGGTAYLTALAFFTLPLGFVIMGAGVYGQMGIIRNK